MHAQCIVSPVSSPSSTACKLEGSLERFDGFAEAVEARLEEAARDPATIALKSIIAYRTGLDIAEPDEAAARAGFERWRASGWVDDRVHAKAVRDALLHRAMAVVERHGLALHVHCGDGDPDVVFQHSRPQDLYPFLTRYRNRPIVLMHAGHPWSEEAAYLASILPHVFVDLSVLVPWASVHIPAYLTSMLGMTPSRKLLYSSDQVYEPELFWIPARMARRGSSARSVPWSSAGTCPRPTRSTSGAASSPATAGGCTGSDGPGAPATDGRSRRVPPSRLGRDTTRVRRRPARP